jgi:hypothetical protein
LALASALAFFSSMIWRAVLTTIILPPSWQG